MPLHGKPEETAKPFDAEADDEQPPDDESEIGGEDTEVLTDPDGVAAAPPPAEPAEAKSSAREYVVLKQAAKGGPWAEVKRVEATGADAAIRSLGQDGLEDGVTYVAVPSRSWNPVKVEVKTTTTISVG